MMQKTFLCSYIFVSIGKSTFRKAARYTRDLEEYNNEFRSICDSDVYSIVSK